MLHGGHHQNGVGGGQKTNIKCWQQMNKCSKSNKNIKCLLIIFMIYDRYSFWHFCLFVIILIVMVMVMGCVRFSWCVFLFFIFNSMIYLETLLSFNLLFLALFPSELKNEKSNLWLVVIVDRYKSFIFSSNMRSKIHYLKVVCYQAVSSRPKRSSGRRYAL